MNRAKPRGVWHERSGVCGNTSARLRQTQRTDNKSIHLRRRLKKHSDTLMWFCVVSCSIVKIVFTLCSVCLLLSQDGRVSLAHRQTGGTPGGKNATQGGRGRKVIAQNNQQNVGRSRGLKGSKVMSTAAMTTSRQRNEGSH